MSAATAASHETYESYSAWENLVHCVFFKFHLTRVLGAAEQLLPYPWKEGSFPDISDTSEHAWNESLAYAEKVHTAYIQRLGTLTEGELDQRIEEWDCTVKEAVIWMPAHDTYHVAQIRNMGLAELRQPRNDAGHVDKA